MKFINKQLGISTALILGIIMIFLPGHDESKYQFDPENLSKMIVEGEDQISPETLSEWIIEERSDYRLIDIRTEKEYTEGHIKSSENITLGDILKKDIIEELTEDPKIIVIYSNGNSHANQAWLILKSAGIDVYVVEGGMNYWNKRILNPKQPSDMASDDEILTYRTKTAIAGFFGGGSGTNVSNKTTIPLKKKIFKKKPKKKKKKLEGC
ncbi:MAG: rhodanese-like domain-containing protein [Acidobacteriota bacterium]